MIPEIAYWRPVTSPPVLPPGGLHLWRIRTGNGGASVADLRPLLSQREFEISQRLRFSHHRERYVRAHAGLRILLSKYINCTPQRVVFAYGDAGKPLLRATTSNLEFNMATSGDLACVAVSAEEPVGIDCEQVRERGHLTAIARRMFAPEDASRIAAAAEHDRLMRFHLAWTALEAGVKADGRGLARRTDPVAQGTLDIGHCVPQTGFIAAVARRYLPRVEEWTTMEIASGLYTASLS